MKELLFGLICLIPCFAAAEKKKPADPADSRIVIHVQSSRLAGLCAPGCVWVQHLTVLIEGSKYELSDTVNRIDLLRVGDYRARILKDETDHPYEYQRTDELLMSDGGLPKYMVVAETE